MQPVYIDFLNGPDIDALDLGNDEILDAIEASLAIQGRGEAVIEPRTHLIPGDAIKGHFNILRGVLGGDIGYAGVKWSAISSTTIVRACRRNWRSST
ncbi:hypothetical protein [Pseudomonas asplenii]|uniref:hypothetical protein n=1 Tax=Pseudomonas asplenii TaxID=53407 RepID=UPI0006CDAE8D|nr:hypothetical protein [Pseudomonas fuscovaginae]KPA98417.1 hypothetical protein PF70_01423 [Pseudomonas fuscovaginae]